MAAMADVIPITKNPRAELARSNSHNLISFAHDLIEAGYTPESVPGRDDPCLREAMRVMQWILDGKAPGSPRG
jgi:hypothetical protein